MDVFEPELALRKKLAVETSKPRPPLVPAEKNNVNTTHRPRTKEVTSRYKSPTPSTASGARRCPSTASGVRRCPSPDIKRSTPSSSQLVPKRAQSVERRRPSTPPSPPSPSTPVKDSSVNKHLASKRVAGGRLPEGLWPSTMRNLCVSFQSDSNSIPVCKKEKPVTSSSDRTLRPSSNVAHKHVETPSVLRKPTPERKRSPLKGKNAPDQSENSKPVDSSQARLIDQHRWPTRAGGKVSSNSLTKSMDLADKTGRTTIQLPAIGLSSLRRASLPDSIGRPLKKSASEALRLLSLEESGKAVLERTLAVDDSFQTSFSRKLLSLSSSDRLMVTNPAVRSPSLPSNRSRPPSPCKASRGVSPSPTRPSTPPSRGVSPSRIRPSTPPSRGVSPSRIRPSTPPSRGISPSRIRPGSSCQSNNPDSVLSFIADIKKGKKGANYIEDTHQLRLLYNRYLQWRFANARAESLLHVQKVTSETTLFNVWHETLSLWDSVIRKRIDLQQQKLELKLKSVFNDQLAYLDDWALLEKHHIAALSGAVEDLESNTLRLPVTRRASTDIDSLKIAICSAVDVMQAMASSTCSLLPRVEGMGSLVSELAVIAAREKAMLDECEALLASIAAMQVEECSHRTHLLQTKQALEMLSGNFWQSRHVHNL